jgi:acyl transferase domain-containing protein
VLDEKADGYVRGEACNVVVLGTLDSPAEAAVAVIGSAVGQDGRSSSLTAPNGPAQQRVVRAALLAAAADPSIVAGPPVQLFLLAACLACEHAQRLPRTTQNS